MAKEKIKGITKFVATKVLGTPDGQTAPFYRIAELHFPSIEVLKESAASAGAQEAVATQSLFPAEADQFSWLLRKRV